MELFDFGNSKRNLLPYDGEAFYYGKVFSKEESIFYLQTLLRSIDWKNDEVVMYGKRIVTKRKVAWYGRAGFSYTYSGTTRIALPLTPELQSIQEKVEATLSQKFNSCLLNLYHTGEEGMSWHSDDEHTLQKHGCIASLSFGATRKFYFKHKTTKETISQFLESGDLLTMEGKIQEHWQHSVPKMQKVNTPRINLTFRNFLV